MLVRISQISSSTWFKIHVSHPYKTRESQAALYNLTSGSLLTLLHKSATPRHHSIHYTLENAVRRIRDGTQVFERLLFLILPMWSYLQSYVAESARIYYSIIILFFNYWQTEICIHAMSLKVTNKQTTAVTSNELCELISKIKLKWIHRFSNLKLCHVIKVSQNNE